MPAATREEVFEVTIPANTAESAPVTVNTHFNPGTVIAFDLVFPPGPAGLTGARITTNGQAIWPRTHGSWVIADNEVIKREVVNWPNSGRLEITGFNTDINPHTLEVRYQVVENASERAPLTAAQSEPIALGVGGEPASSGETPTPAPPSTPEGEGSTEPPAPAEAPPEPKPEGEVEPAPTPSEPTAEGEPAPAAPPEPEPAPETAAQPLAPEAGAEPEVPEPGAPAPAASPGPQPLVSKAPTPTRDKQIAAYMKAHHGKRPTRKQLETWLRSQAKRKPAPARAKKSSVRAAGSVAKRAGAARRLPAVKRLGIIPSQTAKRKAAAAKHAEPSRTTRRASAPTAVRGPEKRAPAKAAPTAHPAESHAHSSAPTRRAPAKAPEHHAAAPAPRRAPAPEHHAAAPPPPPRRAAPPPPPPPPPPRREAPKPARKGRR